MIPTKFPCRMQSKVSGRTVVIISITSEDAWGPNTGTGYYDPALPDSAMAELIGLLPGVYLGNGIFNDFNLDNLKEVKEN